ncbi:MAG: MFS transporter [Acidobacteria bacterium]|nr:MFS transporter [Acidobacteriota bacterium]
MTSAVAPLKYPHFRSLWGASVFSASGTFIQAVAASWLMFELTGSSTWVGWMVASALLPLFFLALTAGALADMFDRTKLMLIAQGIMGGSAVAMAVLTYMDLINPPLLLGLGLLLGTGLALNIPAWQALVPDLVPRGLVASAVALQSVAFNSARAVGPAVGGVIIVAFGPEAGFAINALTYIAVIVVLLVIGPQLAVRERETASMGSAITLGIRFARFTPTFRNLLALVALFALTSAVVQATLPVHTDHLGGSAAMFGVLLGAMGVGALVGAFLRPMILRRLKGNLVAYTITLFGVSGIMLGLAPNLVVATVAMVLVGIFWLLTLSTLNASAQLMAPEWIRGRAMSLYTLAFAGILPVGSILSGMLADQIGTSGSIVAFSSGALVIGLMSPRFGVPRIDDIDTPEFTPERVVQPHNEASLEGGPVIVLNTWTIDETDFAGFTDIMNEIRLVRLSTGAYRWRLFRSTTDPTRLTELFAVASWEEHLAQHTRIDDASAALITRARSFDRADGPKTRHLIAIDVERPPDFDDLVATHEELHQVDGSIPVPDQDV